MFFLKSNFIAQTFVCFSSSPFDGLNQITGNKYILNQLGPIQKLYTQNSMFCIHKLLPICEDLVQYNKC